MYQYPIEKVLDVSVSSAFYESDSKETAIEYYNLTRLTETAMDIQVKFIKPTLITQSAAEPDEISVRFKESSMFMDGKDFEQLEDNL